MKMHWTTSTTTAIVTMCRCEQNVSTGLRSRWPYRIIDGRSLFCMRRRNTRRSMRIVERETWKKAANVFRLFFSLFSFFNSHFFVLVGSCVVRSDDLFECSWCRCMHRTAHIIHIYMVQNDEYVLRAEKSTCKFFGWRNSSIHSYPMHYDLMDSVVRKYIVELLQRFTSFRLALSSIIGDRIVPIHNRLSIKIAARSN